MYSSLKQIFYSVVGVIYPYAVMDKKIWIKEGVHELGHFPIEKAVKANFFEKNLMRMHFVANVINEFIATVLSSFRWLMNKVILTLEFKGSPSLNDFTFHNFQSISNHFFYLIGSVAGVLIPGSTLVRMSYSL